MSEQEKNRTQELLDAVKAVPPEAEKTAIAYLQGMAAMAAANAEKKEETLK